MDTQTPDQKARFEKAVILGSEGKLDKAMNVFITLAEEVADDFDFLLQVARQLESIKRYGKAQDVLLQIIQADPDFVPANLMLGDLYLQIQKPVLAAGCFEKALSLEPGNGKAWFSLGRARYEEKDLEKALAATKEALRLGERSAVVYRLMLVILENLNRLDDMKALLKDAIQTHPDDELMQILKAKLEARTGSFEAALERLKAIGLEGKEPDVAAALCYEMGSIFDSTGQYEKSFEAFLAANGHRKKVFDKKNFNARQALKDIAEMDAFKLGLLQQNLQEPQGSEAFRPVFQIGFPRSGTTLLSYILDAHSEIEIMQETLVLHLVRQKLVSKFGKYPALLKGLSQTDIRDAVIDYREFCQTVGKVNLENIVVDKVPLNILHVPMISKIFPRARLVFSLRHPCDSCLSCFMQNFGENNEMANFLDLEQSIKYYARVMSLWLKFSEQLPLNFHLVKYENLVENMENEAIKLIAFLGLDWEVGVLSYREKLAQKGFLKTPSYAQVVKPIYKKSINRWHNYKKFFEPYFNILRPFCDRFGYSLDE